MCQLERPPCRCLGLVEPAQLEQHVGQRGEHAHLPPREAGLDGELGRSRKELDGRFVVVLLAGHVAEAADRLGLTAGRPGAPEVLQALVQKLARLLRVLEMAERADSDPVQEDGDPLVVSERAEQRETLLVLVVRELVPPGQPERAGVAAKRPRPQPLGKLLAGRQKLLEATRAFERVGRDPEVLQQDHELDRTHAVTCGHGAVDGCTEVLLLAQQELRSLPVVALRGGVGCLCERAEEVVVAATGVLELAGLLQLLDCKLADRLQQRVALRAEADEALLDQRLQHVQPRSRHLFRGVDGPAAGEDAEPPERLLLPCREQLVAPGDRAAESALALGHVASAHRQQRQRAVEPLEDLRRREHLHTRGRQLEREREVVEPPADLEHVLVGLQVGARRTRSAEEEPDALLLDEGRHCVLALGGEVQRLAARREQAQVRARREQLRERRRRVKHLLEVVEEQEHVLRADVLRKLAPRPQCRADRREDEVRLPKRLEADPPHAVLEVVDELRSRLHRKACLPGAAGAGQGQEPHLGVTGQGEHIEKLLLAADKGRRLLRQVRLVQRTQRRKLPAAELVDALRGRQVLEPVLA